MPSRRPAGRSCRAAELQSYRSGVSLRETGRPVAVQTGELPSCKLGESSELRRRLGKSSELKVERETSELARGEQHRQVRFSSSSFGDKRIQVCQRAKGVKRVTVEDLTKLKVYEERRMEEEEQLYATVRRVKGEGEGFRPYQAPRQQWGYQVKEDFS